MPLANYIVEFQALDRKAQATAVIHGKYTRAQLQSLEKYATSETVLDTIKTMLGHGEMDFDDVVEPEVLPPESKKTTALSFSTEAAENWHYAAQHHAQIAVICAARAGAELNKIKAECGHGEWQKIVSSLPFSVSTAKNYRNLATQLADRLQELGTGAAFELLSLPEPENLADPIYAEQLEQINQVTGEQTLRQLYFDWGICKAPKQLGGARDPKPPKPLENGETQAHRDACELVFPLMDQLQALVIGDRRVIQHMTVKELQVFEADLVDSLLNVRNLIAAG